MVSDLLIDVDPRLAAAVMQMVRLCVWLLLLSVVFLPLERLCALHPAKVFRKEVGTDLLYYFISSLTPALVLSMPLAAVAWVVHLVMPHAYLVWVSGTPVLARTLAALIVGEVGFYWGHRWSHEVPLLWRFHAVHHSAEHMDFLVNTRAHPVDIVFTRLCGMVPLYVLGLGGPARGTGGLVPVLVVLAGTVWGFLLHSNLRWRFGALEHAIATPAFHHWHHAADDPAFFNTNYAALMPCVDRIFGTLHLPADRHPQRYGTDDAQPRGVAGQVLAPFLSGTTPSS